MGAFAPTVSKDATLVAATVDTLTFDKTGVFYEIVNRSTTADIFVRFDGTNPVVADGAGAADGCTIVRAGESIRRQVARTAVVKLISSGTPAYIVEQL
jgi:hypothetical protein